MSVQESDFHLVWWISHGRWKSRRRVFTHVNFLLFQIQCQK